MTKQLPNIIGVIIVGAILYFVSTLIYRVNLISEPCYPGNIVRRAALIEAMNDAWLKKTASMKIGTFAGTINV